MGLKKKRFSLLRKADQGASALEYALVMASISMAIYSASLSIGYKTSSNFSDAAQVFKVSATATPAPGVGAPGGIGGGGGGPGDPSDDGGNSPDKGLGYSRGTKDGG